MKVIVIYFQKNPELKLWMLWKQSPTNQKGNADVNFPDKDGRTALFVASQEGHDAVVKTLLIEGNADVNFPDKDGYTALHLASEKGHVTVVKTLLKECNTDPNIPTKELGLTGFNVCF